MKDRRALVRATKRQQARPQDDTARNSQAFMWAYDAIKGWGEKNAAGEWKEWTLYQRIAKARELAGWAVFFPAKDPLTNAKKRWPAVDGKRA